MKIVHNYAEFFKRVKPLFYDDLENIGLFGSSAAGIFDNHRFTELTEFCSNNPKYHIISILEGGVEFNRPIDTKALYLLGLGDDDPELVYIAKISWKAFENLQVLKFRTHEL